jgi:uncharacterized repeat protein (TIGR01451 family)
MKTQITSLIGFKSTSTPPPETIVPGPAKDVSTHSQRTGRWLAAALLAALPLAAQAQLDFGDAPAPYPTVLPAGARHGIVAGMSMGPNIDAEPNGLPNPNALGDDLAGIDDEDGVAFFGAWRVGLAANIQINVTLPGRIDAWADFNRDGIWQPVEEFLIAAPVVAGPNPFIVPVPGGIGAGPVFVRFRYSQAGGLPPDGPAPNGEVEDYRVPVLPPPGVILAFAGVNPPITQEGGPRVLSLLVSNVGPGDAESVVVTDLLAEGTSFVGANVPAQGSGHQRSFDLGVLPVGGAVWLEITNKADQVDFAGGESVELKDTVLVAVPQTAVPVLTNYLVGVVLANLDFGDAPAPPYPTLRPNGARHSRNGLHFGGAPDLEPNGNPTLLANGDDVTGVDDENGIAFLTPINAGTLAQVQIALSLPGRVDAWLDFNRDGDWLDAGEQILVSAALPAGVSVLAFPVPMWTAPGQSYARFRVSAGGGLAPTGFCNGGEVEDYLVNLLPAANPPAAKLNLTHSNGTLVVGWDRPGAILQQATSADGPWTLAPQAENPTVLGRDAGARFFRVLEGRSFNPAALGNPNLGWLAQEADLIVDAVVTGIEYRNSVSNSQDQVSWPHTFVTLQILETFKGRTTSSNLCLRFVGGADESDPSLVVRLSHSTLFDIGERSILFVRGNGHSACPLVGGGRGRIRLSGGQVFGESGRPLLRNAAGKIIFGRGNSLAEVLQDTIGTNVLARVRSQHEGENPEEPEPQGQSVSHTQFRAVLQQEIAKWNPAEVLQNPVLVPSADAGLAFSIERPRHHKPAAPPQLPPAQSRGEPNPAEDAALHANGMNPVLR